MKVIEDQFRPIVGLNGITLDYLLERNSVIWSNRLAIVDVDSGRNVTYQDLDKRVNQLANGLLRLGIKSGDHVSYLINDKAECVELIFAINRIGAVWIPCNYRFTEQEILAQMVHSDAVAIVFDNEFETVISNIRNHLTIDASHYIAIGETVEVFTSYEKLLSGGSPDKPNVQIQDTATCGIIYTSGTTGVPKGAIHTHQTIIGWAMNPILVAGWRWDDRILNPYPMFHLGGTVTSIAIMMCGATNYIFGKFKVNKFLKIIEHEKISAIAVVPTILNSILKNPEQEIKQYDWSSLRKLATSSAPLMSDAQDLMQKYWPQVQLFSLYSTTELFYSALLPDDQLRKKRCVGRPAYGMEVKIINEVGEETEPNEIGLIYGRGVSLFKGYYNNPDANNNGFLEGWFTCEDMGYFDEEGYLYIVDRKKDMIISGGENISSIEVEDLILTHDDVLEVAVIGVPDDYWGERVHAVLTLKPGRTLSEAELIEWCKSRIAGFKRPRSFEVVSEIPKSPVGKISKKELRAIKKNKI